MLASRSSRRKCSSSFVVEAASLSRTIMFEACFPKDTGMAVTERAPTGEWPGAEQPADRSQAPRSFAPSDDRLNRGRQNPGGLSLFGLFRQAQQIVAQGIERGQSSPRHRR